MIPGFDITCKNCGAKNEASLEQLMGWYDSVTVFLECRKCGATTDDCDKNLPRGDPDLRPDKHRHHMHNDDGKFTPGCKDCEQ